MEARLTIWAMKNVFLALSLALVLGPAAALADTTSNAPPQRPALTQQQRQALKQTFETFGTKEKQLHQQFRSDVLSAISAHRSAIAGVIGQLAISSDPNPQTAAKQLDALMSQGEQQRVLALHQQFRTQSKALRDQMRQQLRSELPPPPNGAPPWNGQKRGEQTPPTPDAGMIVLMTLTHGDREGFMGMGMGHHGWMGPGPGGPPQP
jgi:hypothetical protein